MLDQFDYEIASSLGLRFTHEVTGRDPSVWSLFTTLSFYIFADDPCTRLQHPPGYHWTSVILSSTALERNMNGSPTRSVAQHGTWSMLFINAPLSAVNGHQELRAGFSES